MVRRRGGGAYDEGRRCIGRGDGARATARSYSPHVPSRRAVASAGLPIALAVLGVVETAVNASLAGDRLLTGVTVLLLAAAVGLRGRSPDAAACFAGACLVLSALLGGHGHDESFIAVVCVLVLSFTVAAERSRTPALRGLAGLLGGLLVAIAIRGDVFDALLATIVVGAAWAGGRVVHRLHAQKSALEAVSEQLRAERDRTAADAVLAERARIARDLHDVVAHHVSVMVVQAGGARGVLQADPAAAEQALLTVEHTGRAALVEMRRLLGVLRAEDAGRAPQPRLRDAVGLLSPDDNWVVEGRTAELDPGLDLTAFRLVQEALTNVRRHGTGPARVHVTWQPQQLEIVVDNDRCAEAGSSGHGLLGMAERAALYGGTVTAGPCGRNRWRLHAVLPLAPVASRA